ncbi:response regulator [Cohnella sp. REN36]|uniref:response regulator transcription factor n=1 Tax=Cohnella sp. REN36 TaxID=2887347 RepID=UPI001D144735|nr:response regulator [Cohnella sp. REN36]MCC3371965.1 response regulator [Cohnella sp. REN36]
MKILIVEDEAKIRQGIRALVEQIVPSRLQVTEAASGKEAWEWLRRQEEVDLVITDIRMREMNGLELMGLARQSHPSAAFIVISGYDEFAYVREALRYGAADYLLKPIERVELARVLHRIREEADSRKGEAPDDAPDDAPGDDNERLLIRKVKNLVNERLDRELSLSYLAEHVYLHPKYLSDMFKRETGQNLSDYVTERRMHKAKKLLKETALKVPDISQMCGLANHKYFRALFKQHAGCTPNEFRDA